ncbi:integrase arm-type DNA-binding domain-containing protein [Mesorhizobium sp. C277A]|uniref:tyrosine-type recombinase/integrase n=1 Tax=unclassified Mesorhizobium TaxID=325217 RepID=UPI000A05A50D|nr:site-specific integrase [Mesorhizobium sp. LSJC277A00]
MSAVTDQGNAGLRNPSKVLTAKTVEAAKPEAKNRREIPDGALPGLYLVVQPTGVKSWALRYRFDGKPKKLTIGPVLLKREGDEIEGTLPLGQSMTLQEARRAARDAIQTLGEGRDPGTAKKEAKAHRAADTGEDKDSVEKQGQRFIARYCKPRNRSWKEVERQFKIEINPHWGKKGVHDITKRDVLDLLDAVIDRGSPVTANRIFATLRRFFGWLIERDILKASPCAGMKKPTPETSRERILTSDEIKLFWQATEGFDHPFGPMWRLLLLTGQRRNEIAGMKRGELALDDDAPAWTIPGARTKNGNEHFVPLAPGAATLIKSLPRIGDKGFVFTTTGETAVSGFSRSKGRLDLAMLAILRDTAAKAGDDPARISLTPWTLHDLRRTMASGMAALNISLPVVEKVLNHSSGSFAGIVGVYQRFDFAKEKRAALLAWADFIDALVTERPAANVVKLREVVA